MKKLILNIISIVLSILILSHIILLISGIKLYSVKTGSMEPEIHQGSLVYVKTYKTKDDIYDNIDVGTDITYSTNNKIFVTHRVISLSEENGTLQTQGIIDNAAIEDNSYTQVVGKVVFVIPLLGYVILLLKSWYIWTILILTVVIVFIFKLLLKELEKNKILERRHNAMKRKVKICILVIMLFMALAFGGYQTYAFLTYTHTITNNYTIDSVKATITVTGASADTTVVNDDLAYIHYVDDFINLDKYGLLDTMASELRVSISINNTFDSRVKITLPSLDELNGLVYVIIDDSADTINSKVNFSIENGMIKYAYENTEAVDLVDISSLNNNSTNAEFRELINEYNQTKLKQLYTGSDNVYQTGTLNFRILVWGDYYSLSDSDKPSYLDKTYNFNVYVKVIQALDKYGGKLDYEND